MLEEIRTLRAEVERARELLNRISRACATLELMALEPREALRRDRDRLEHALNRNAEIERSPRSPRPGYPET